MKVLSAGFVCGDLVLAAVDELPPSGGNRFVDQAALAIGGCAANAAVGLARLLTGADDNVAVAGRVGADPLGDLLRSALAAAGVRTDPLLATTAAATAINTVLVSSSGERSFYVFDGACRLFTPSDLPDSLLRQFDHLHLAAVGSLAGLAGDAGAGVARRAQALGLTVSLDVTLNPPRDTAADVLPLLPFVDLFLPNLAEAQAVLGVTALADVMQAGLAQGVKLLGIKLGAAGCLLATPQEQRFVPGFAVSAVDTVGAGDAWGAALITGWRQGWTLPELGWFANAAGALCTQQPGATAGMASAEEIWAFLAAAGA